MLFSGLEKNSFIDYNGKISCVIFTSGCNFSCPFCHNPNAAKGETISLAEEDLYNFLIDRKAFLDGVVISGGEPTIHKDLFKFCEQIKKIGYQIKLDTNGSNPDSLKKLIHDQLIDYIAMDIKTSPSLYNKFISNTCSPKDIISSIKIIMGSNVKYEFRTTCIKPIISENIIKNISQIISGASLYALQHFNNSKILEPSFFKSKNQIYDDNELAQFKYIVSPFVKECIIR
ncbi:MAG: anaerobic ribonucleoside-triphosphate reductase activating protein [Desulfobacterales bacterium]|nr:anaerobic ribonucleoside-triphosphate reductase activating protein [Desulfobacterales bacterium]